MLLLERKEGKRGEIKVVLTEQDRAELYLNGLNWVNINEIINDFNQDPDINDLYLSATYAGDLKPEILNNYLENASGKTASKPNDAKLENKSDKEKVHSDGSSAKDDELGDIDDEDLQAQLKDLNLKCTACGDEGTALIDRDGKIHHCESCIKIDAYLKGKKEGFEAGFDKGYQAAIENLMKLTNGLDQDIADKALEEKGKAKENGKENS